MAQQSEVESAHARRVSRQRRGRGGRHPPARVSGARHRIGINAQKQGGDARLLRREGQAPAGGQIKLRSAAGKFKHHRAQRRAPQALHGPAQGHRLILHHADQQLRRIDSQSGKARSIRDHPARGGERTQPQGRRFRPRKAREDQRKAGGRSLSAFIGKKLMHSSQRQAAAQRLVDRRITEGEMSMARRSRAIQRGNPPPEGGKGQGRLGHH